MVQCKNCGMLGVRSRLGAVLEYTRAMHDRGTYNDAGKEQFPQLMCYQDAADLYAEAHECGSASDIAAAVECERDCSSFVTKHPGKSPAEHEQMYHSEAMMRLQERQAELQEKVAAMQSRQWLIAIVAAIIGSVVTVIAQRLLLPAPLLALCAAALHAQQPAKPLVMPASVTRAEKHYAEEVATYERLRDQSKAALDKNCAEAIAKERAKLIESLEAAKADAAKKVDLPLANAIQKKIEAVGRDDEDRETNVPIGRWHSIVGEIAGVPKSHVRQYNFAANGRVTINLGGRDEPATWAQRDGALFVQRSGGKVDKLTPRNDGLFSVECYEGNAKWGIGVAFRTAN